MQFGPDPLAPSKVSESPPFSFIMISIGWLEILSIFAVGCQASFFIATSIKDAALYLPGIRRSFTRSMRILLPSSIDSLTNRL
ncbi:hypothetical protein ES703_118082 [subsurface metagenome]